MDLKPLTADEKATAQKAKGAANGRIAVLRAEMVKSLAGQYARKDEREREARTALPFVTGSPVRVFDEDFLSITLDYEVLHKFTRSLRKGWTCDIRLLCEHGKPELILTYEHQSGKRRGRMRMCELPQEHMTALHGLRLPNIELNADPARETVPYAG